MSPSRISLMRHGEATPGPRDDATRQLTATGNREVSLMGEFMVRAHGTVDAIITSYFDRAHDTAKIMAEALGCQVIHETPYLEPNADPVKAWKEIQRLSAGKDHVLVVTHYPLVCTLLETICGAKTNDVRFHYAAIAHVHDGLLRWFVDPKLIARDEEDAVIEAALAVMESQLE
jgi:phosphohistidine phosphatase